MYLHMYFHSGSDGGSVSTRIVGSKAPASSMEGSSGAMEITQLKQRVGRLKEANMKWEELNGKLYAIATSATLDNRANKKQKTIA